MCHQQTIELQIAETIAYLQTNYTQPFVPAEYPMDTCFQYHEHSSYDQLVWRTTDLGVTDPQAQGTFANPQLPPDAPAFILWNPIATTAVLPGEFVPVAKAVHGGEALLVVLAIIVWHMYHVHLRRFNKSMFTGYLSEEEMREEHPLELAERKANPTPQPRPDSGDFPYFR